MSGLSHRFSNEQGCVCVCGGGLMNNLRLLFGKSVYTQKLRFEQGWASLDVFCRYLKALYFWVYCYHILRDFLP